MYFAAVLTLLGIRYFVLPRVDQWRPQIERYAGDALGARVQIGHIAADWSGLNPRLKLTGVHIDDANGQQVLSLPSVEAVVAWRSVLDRAPRLVMLRADGLDLTLRRDAANRLWVAGLSIDLSASSGGAHPGIRWLAQQREIVLHQATLHWIDELRNTPELVLHDVGLVSLNGRLSHRFALRAQPPQALARAVEFRGEIDRSLFVSNSMDLANWRGQVYAEISDSAPSALAPWLTLPPIGGRMAARAWMQIDGANLGTVTLDAALRGASWQAADGTGFHAGTVQGRFEGMPGDLLRQADLPFSRSVAEPGISLSAQASDVKVTAPPDLLQDPHLAFDTVQIDASLRRTPGGVLALGLNKLHVANADLDATLHGSWLDQGKTAAGSADLQGNLARADMTTLHRYLPLAVSADARTWLARSILAGQIHDAGIVLKGDLDDFPYSEPGAAGQLHIGGTYTGAAVDYAPPRDARKGWPAIEGLDGTFAIDGAALTMEVRPGGVFRVAGTQAAPISLRGLKAAIPNMEHHAELYVQGESDGPAQAYLSAASASPLGGMLDNVLDRARGSGAWRLAVAMHVPLLHLDDARVEGTLVFNDNEFALFPDLPAFGQLRGMLEFSEKDLRAHDVQAQFLGGPVKINGSLLDGKNGLRFNGIVTAAALPQLIRAKAMSRFSGQAAYRGRLLYRKGGSVDVTVESDLAGMAVNLPAPAGKDAASALPLKVQWSPAQDVGPKNRSWLTASLGDNINLLLEHDPADNRAYFARGAVGANQAATLPQQGLSLKINVPELDVDAWQSVGNEFDAPVAGSASVSATSAATSAARSKHAAAVSWLPQPDQIAVTTPRLRVAGLTLNDLALYAVRPAESQWRVDIQSRQAAGSLFWREASGAIAGQINARFKYLAFGGDKDNTSLEDALSSSDELSDIPAVDLQSESFRLYGKDLGSMQVLGTNLERGRRWRLDKLRLANDAASLDATGVWRLSGADRGLTVDASTKLNDFGKLLTRLGLPDTVAGGTGSGTSKLTWRDLPWSHDLANLDGTLEFSLDKGRFVHVNSRTARLLELLSMQSVQRLARLDFNPRSLLRDGFPFDTIRAHIGVSKGVLSTDDYKVNGPVAAIVLAGNTSIIDETWDLKAVVVPNLDASGAAVVTALAVNPLLGLGAFLTQWVLKHPLARAMTMQYAVTGTWNDPKVAPIDAPLPPVPGPDARAKEFIEH